MAIDAPAPVNQPVPKDTKAPHPTPPAGFSDWASL